MLPSGDSPATIRRVALVIGVIALIICVVSAVEAVQMTTSGKARYKPTRYAEAQLVERATEPKKFNAARNEAMWACALAGVFAGVGVSFFRRLGD